jgi:hypothetical protein
MASIIINLGQLFINLMKLFKEPLINYVISLAHRLIRNQGVTLNACVGLVKSCTKSRRTSDAECGSACEPRRAGSETHIYRVA